MATATRGVNPYAKPNASVAEATAEYQDVRLFSIAGRIGRLRYIAYSFGVAILLVILGAAIGLFIHPILALVAYAAMIVIGFMLTIQRCHDFNMNRWLSLLVLLPLYGAFTVGLHAGFAVYFPELFPDHLRASGAGLCFNGGRALAASLLLLSAWLKSLPGMNLRLSLSLLALLFVPGMLLLLGLPETNNRPLLRGDEAGPGSSMGAATEPPARARVL